MNSGLRYFSLSLVCVVLRGFGQTVDSPTQPTTQAPTSQTSSTSVEMPSDPAALLELAAKKNGLQNVTSAPWHLKATYEVMDEKGQAKDKGEFEEFWVSESKHRSSYSSSNFNQTLIATEKGFYSEGDVGTPRGAASLVRWTLLHGISLGRDWSKGELKLEERSVGSGKIKCITIAMKSSVPFSPEVECLDDHLPVLRISVRASGSLHTLYEEIVLFEGVYVARLIQLKSESKAILRVHINVLEPYTTVDEALFVAPPDAVYAPRMVTAPSAVTVGNIAKKVAPRYPATAKQQRIQGVVVLHAVITREGKISDLQPIVGPVELIPGAVDAVKQWEYHPYLLNGVPVEVETEINVVFCLSCR
jgi:TonB family protein